MPHNKKNINEDLAHKVAHEEGLKAEEIAKDISLQKPSQHATPDTLSHRVAQQEGLSQREINKDVSEQLGSTRTAVQKASSKVWLYIVIIVAFVAAAWVIFSKYF